MPQSGMFEYWDVVTEIISTDPTLSPQAVAFEIVVAWAAQGGGVSQELVEALKRGLGWKWNVVGLSEDGE